MRRMAMLMLFWAFAGGAYAHGCPGAPGWAFVDVAQNDPFCPQITWLAERGVTLGCEIIDAGHRMFCPGSATRRDQLAAFLYRTAGTLFPLNCAPGSVMQWNGTDWVCAIAVGPPGPQGIQGPPGPPGRHGSQGVPGSARRHRFRKAPPVLKAPSVPKAPSVRKVPWTDRPRLVLLDGQHSGAHDQLDRQFVSDRIDGGLRRVRAPRSERRLR